MAQACGREAGGSASRDAGIGGTRESRSRLGGILGRGCLFAPPNPPAWCKVSERKLCRARAPPAERRTMADGEKTQAPLPCPWDQGSAKPPCRWRFGSLPQRARATRAGDPCSPPGLGPCAGGPPPAPVGSLSRGRCPGCFGVSWRPAAPRSGHRNPASCSRRRPPHCRTCLRTSAAGPGLWCPAWLGTRADRLRGSCPSLFGPRPWPERDSGPRAFFPSGGKGSCRWRARSHSDWGGRRRLSLRARGGTAAPIPASSQPASQRGAAICSPDPKPVRPAVPPRAQRP